MTFYQWGRVALGSAAILTALAFLGVRNSRVSLVPSPVSRLHRPRTGCLENDTEPVAGFSRWGRGGAYG
jgi:hypothetical protein